MVEMHLNDFEGFFTWTSRWINYAESYHIAKPEIQIDFFGGPCDSAYLVIDFFTSNDTCTEYIFLPDKEKDENRSMALVFNFLLTVDYSLTKLLEWLENANFITHELGERVLIGDLTIERRFSQFNHTGTEEK